MAYRSTLLTHEPDWRSVSNSRLHQSPAHIRSWLLESGSLTRRLKVLCGEHFNVSVQYQHWSRPTLQERQVLGIRHRDYANIREVLLCYDNSVFVIARTVIPRQMLVGRQRHLISLGNRPLGEVIFAEPGLTYSSFEIAVIKSDTFQSGILSEPYDSVTIWGRRTCYLLHNKPILISEIFLPALMHYEATKA